MIEFWPLQSVRFGSSAVGSLRLSEMAAIKGFPDAQTRIFDFPNLTAAYEQSPDGQITRNTSSLQAASGQERTNLAQR